ncbi:MAG: serine/threonine-protein kinase [Deltaproteobacteria bacterium]|nr:serine/threonine-protein kinase [Deltaproteobacteria bacterium]
MSDPEILAEPPRKAGSPATGEGPTTDAGGADPYVGRLIGDRYRILDRLGEGGMGLVFRGEHVLMKKAVAIKLLHRELGNVDDATKRFEREAQSASRLSHPSIVGVTDFGRADTGELFLVMEYVPGGHLGEYLQKHGRLSPSRALMITRLMLRGLAHAHQAGVVHRDLKPANVMLLESDLEPGRIDGVKILDFGIAKMTEAASATPDAALTRGGMIFGTPSYMSPEQATGEQVDHRTDIYACGVMLYEMLVGRKPFVADDLVKVMAMQVTAAPPAFAKVAPKLRIPEVLESIVIKALQKDRNRRYASAIAFLEALDSAEAQLAQRGRPPMGAKQAAAAASDLGSRALARAKVAWNDPNQRRIFVGASAVVFVALLVTSLFGGAEPIKPKPPTPALKIPLKQAEEAIGAGKLVEAKAILLQQLSKHPDSGRVHFLLGTIAFSEADFDGGLERYKEALKRDRGLRGDAALLLNVKGLMTDRKRAETALSFMAESVGEPAADVFIDVASHDPRAAFRDIARKACSKYGCIDKVDQVASYELDLKQAKTCDAKREAIVGLVGTGDARAAEVLKKARRNRSNALGRWLGIEGSNDCVRKDIEDGLKALGAT